MRIVQVGGLTGRRVDGEWRRSIEVLVENTGGEAVRDVVVRLGTDGWESSVSVDVVDPGTELPVLVPLSGDASVLGLVVTVGYTDAVGERRSITTPWNGGPDHGT